MSVAEELLHCMTAYIEWKHCCVHVFCKRIRNWLNIKNVQDSCKRTSSDMVHASMCHCVSCRLNLMSRKFVLSFSESISSLIINVYTTFGQNQRIDFCYITWMAKLKIGIHVHGDLFESPIQWYHPNKTSLKFYQSKETINMHQFAYPVS